MFIYNAEFCYFRFGLPDVVFEDGGGDAVGGLDKAE